MVIVLAILAVLSLLLTLWQWVVTWRFPLHRRVSGASFTPPVTVLKPLKGLDDKTMECLDSWLKQDYPADIQVLFGVASSDDPVCPLVQELIKENPGRNARLIVCQQSLGANAKVSTLIQLLREAQHDSIVVSDADVFVPADFLTNIVAPLREENIGLVNCFYRIVQPATLAMRWETIAVNADFWSQVLQQRSLHPLDFALGAVMATRRAQLAKIGGLEALADYLADDFQLGNRIVRNRQRNCAVSRGGGLSLRPGGLAGGVVPPTALGQDHPRLQATSLRLQYSKQRHGLAASMAGGNAVQMRADSFSCLPVCARSDSPAIAKAPKPR